MSTAAWLAVAVVCGPLGSITAHAQETHFTMNSQGELERPVGYREWVYVGTPVTPNDLNNGKAPFPEFHAVYMDPASWTHWKETGQFRDGTILVKELISVGSKEAPSGKGYFMGEFIGLEAAVKSAQQFSKEPGNWAYFSFTTADHKTLKPAAAAQATADCNGCHQANAAQDWVFIQYYPVLRAAKSGR
ncbi:MAG: cytochrome P460 family protein [Gammaproteobacteria bacterium]